MIVEEFPLLLSLSLARTALQSKHTLGSSSLFLFSLTMMFSRDDDDDDGKTTARGCERDGERRQNGERRPFACSHSLSLTR